MSQKLIADLAEKRVAAQAEVDAMVASLEAEERAFTDEETATFEERIADIKGYDARIAELESALELRAANDAAAAKLGAAHMEIKEPELYRRSGGEHSFFIDQALANLRGDTDARERLARHSDRVRESRAVTTSTGADAFVPPLWMIDDYAKLARPGRVVANQVSGLELPMGTDSLNLPKVATGTTVASQSTQNSAVSNTDLTSTSVTAPVVTIAGQQVVSLQSLEMSPIKGGFDAVIFADLAAAFAAELERQVVVGAGTGNELKGILTVTNTNSVTYTSTAPTAAGVYGAVANAIGQVHQNRYLPATHIFMTPRRWAWLSAQSDANGRPLVVPNAAGPFNALTGDVTVAALGYVGSMHGLPVYVSAQIPTNLGTGTNEDRIIVARASDAWLWEQGLRADAFQQPNAANLSVLLRVYSYAAFTAERYNTAFTVIGGSGLSATL